MKKICSVLVFCCAFLCSLPKAHALEGLSIKVEKSKNTWVVTYNSERLAQQIAFVSNPDDSRVKRWKPIDTAFEVIYEDQQEYIRRKDGTNFTKVHIILTPSYKALPKAYAPFAPFSDGGVLIHTGRLFACVNLCADDANGWHITIETDENTHFIANGEIYYEPTNWVGYDDGQYVYIGQQKPINEPTFLAMVDQALPSQIKRELNQSLPKIMAFFERQLGTNINKTKPTLFASYSNKVGSDIQGGVLPNQVFIHWDMNNLQDKVTDSDFVFDTLWMFAHEASHFYQESSSLVNHQSESWVHEGNAQWLAALALRKFYPDIIEPIIDKELKSAKINCAKTLAKQSLIEATAGGEYRSSYQCGMVINYLIDKKVRESSHGKLTIFDVWNEFKTHYKNTGLNGAEGFWLVTEKYLSCDVVQKIKVLTTNKIANSEEYIQQLELLR